MGRIRNRTLVYLGPDPSKPKKKLQLQPTLKLQCISWYHSSRCKLDFQTGRPVMRSQHGISKPKKSFNLLKSVFKSPLPRNFVSSLCEPIWKMVMDNEYNALIKNKTWELVSRPPNVNLGNCLKDLGLLSYFLGIAVTCHEMKYADKFIERAGMSSCKSSPTGIDTKPKLGLTTSKPFEDPSFIRVLGTSIPYIQRLDISDVVQHGTIDFCLHFYPSSTSTLISYIDADWGGCPDKRCSTLGYCVFLGDKLISSSAKHHATLSRSSAEAEYRGIGNVATLVYCDNVSVIYLVGNLVQHQCTKHIEMDIHFVREKVARGQ
uniref:Reverse transcriptase Ty1/copia-type domain-containing protein n=1 Tax=Solanum lycopersicum TaxID=4081 RepID=A0A3Q7FYF4_SOLLC